MISSRNSQGTIIETSMAVKESRKVIFKLSSQEWMEPVLKMPRKNFPGREEQAQRVEKSPG